MLREFMAILDATTQEIVSMARSAIESTSSGGVVATADGVSGRPRHRAPADIAEAVMGRDAWDTYRNLEYKNMTGPRRPHGRPETEKHSAAHNKKLGGTVDRWYL